jgi:hypothetical protein
MVASSLADSHTDRHLGIQISPLLVDESTRFLFKLVPQESEPMRVATTA